MSLSNKYFLFLIKTLFTGHVGGCGFNDDVQQWMDGIQNGGLDDVVEKSTEDNKNTLNNKNNKQQKAKAKSKKGGLGRNTSIHEDFNYPYEKYSREANYKNNNINKKKINSTKKTTTTNDNNKYSNDGDDDDDDDDDGDWHAKSHERVRRAARTKEEQNKNTCSLYIQTDPLIWRHIREGIADVRYRVIYEF